MFRVNPKYLLLIAAFVWIFAGANILLIGLSALENFPLTNLPVTCEVLIIIFGAVIAFFAFHPMFSNLVGKHSDRIRQYGVSKQWFWMFFDAKSFVIMAFMMTLGICLRAFKILPLIVLVPFYIGLSVALIIGGVGFIIHYIKRGQIITCPITKKIRLA